ncbi:MAG TPA: hypothetical protein PKJ38_13755 [Planctomycetota bacterium]|nr:hypothetical protein [Planctomycetota bacterium]
MRTSKRTGEQSKRHEEVAKTFLSPDEMARFEAFLEVRGAKKAPYIRQLILRAMDGADGAALPTSGLSGLAVREQGGAA